MFNFYHKYRLAMHALDIADDLADSKTEECRKLNAKLQTAHADLEFANTEKNRQAEEIAKLKRELKQAGETIREQTGADLLVNALRELGVLPKPEKYDAFAEQQRLLAQMQAGQVTPVQSMSELRAAQAQGSQLANILGGGLV